jgi:heterodisulfide reductase subunit A-like polyferredoxin
VTYKSYAQAYPNSYSLTKEGVSPCVLTCPAHVNAHGYVSLAGEGRWQEALEVIMDVLPLPSSLGRICAHPCETECRRRQMEAPLAIRDVKRLVAEKGDMKAAGETFVKEEEKTSGQVAIIGAGPAGLTCAYHLSRRGHKAVIFDKAQTAGGALRLGIPDYRLSPKVLQEEIDFILQFSGAELKLGKALGVDFTIDDLFQQGFKAVFIATGAGRDFSLGLPGENSSKIITCGQFLNDVNVGRKPDLTGKRVLVLGGGNVAMDVARSAVRCGAKAVTAACREGRSIMPAWAWEVHEAEEEGVRIVVLRTPKGFEDTSKGIKAKMGLMVDNKDPRNFVEDPSGDLLVEEYDLIIRSLGQLPSTDLFKDKSAGVEFGRADSIVTDPITLQTGRPGVFAGGDVRTGAKLAIDAVAAGKEVAISIDRLLAGQDLAAGREPMTFTGKEEYRDVPLHEAKKARASMPVRPAEERRLDWEEFELGLSEEACLVEAKRCISCGACCQCYRCVKACLPQAVTVETHAQKDEIIELDVGSVVMATGFDPFDPSNSETYRYTQCPNIVTSMEFERILSASGPFQGHMVRPSDHKEPARIAWLQCVGSRDLNRCDNRYCSAVCCMYAIKEAVIAKEHAGGKLDASVFYMDIRTYGKDFEKYYNRAQDAGVHFVRSRVHTLTPQLNGDVALDYIDDSGQRQREYFDMVVLSVGLNPSATLPELARNLGVELNDDGFVATGAFTPVTTSKPGIHACGAVNEPKDIPYTVMEASAAAEAASREIAEVRGTLSRSVTYPDERDVTGETPRIGVFICHCGINIASIVDVEALTAYAASLPFVELADRNLFTCSQDTQGKIKAAIVEHKLNRVVVASCSPRTHEPMFRETLAQAGINKYLFEMANIRDHDSWVHQKEPGRATSKARDLVRGAVAKAALLEPMYQTQMGLVHEALVIGGGAAGLTAALSLAERGFPVHLVEATGELGGQARRLHTRGKDVQKFLDDLIQKVRNNSHIHLYMNSRPKFSGGFLGNFETVIGGSGEDVTVKHGVTILCAGGAPHEPHSYLYGEHPKVILALDMDAKLKAGDPALLKGRQTYAFVQCVESREPDRPYCSKVCCTHSIENALTILDHNPEASIYILYRDVRAYGYREKLYQEARSRGVRFIRYDVEDKPVLEKGPDGKVRVTVKDHVLGRPLQIDADWVTLASGIDPNPMRDLVEIFKGQLTAELFLLEAHMKLLPVDLATHGQYLAGLAHYPKPLEESLTQAQAVAARAAGTLGHDHIMVGGIVAVVDPKKCAVCCTCVRACPVSVPRIVTNEEDSAARGNAYMEPAICQGCGVCVSECPGKAIKLQFFTDDQLVAKIAAMASGGQEAAN